MIVDVTMGFLIGKKLIEIRPMTKAEMKKEGWETRHGHMPTVLVFDDGTKMYASRDSEGNGPGVMFGCTKKGETFGF